MVTIDAHHHFWQLPRPDLSWLTSGRPVLQDTFGADELRPEIAAAGVDATVLVQAANTAEETERVLRLASATDFVRGAVVWAPLAHPDETAAVLRQCLSHPKFVGVRHVTSRETDPDWLLREDVLESLALLAEHDVPLDVVPAEPRQLANVSTLAERVPELTLVLDHLARPPLPEGGWEPWASLLARAAEHPRTFTKVSVGLDVLETDGNWSADGLRRYIDHTVACFGTDRLLAASNWPVCLLGASYADVWHRTLAVLRELSEPDRAAVLGGTAATVYRPPMHRNEEEVG